MRLKNEIDQFHKEFQIQLANIRSENDAKIDGLTKEICKLKLSLEIETSVYIYLIKFKFT